MNFINENEARQATANYFKNRNFKPMDIEAEDKPLEVTIPFINPTKNIVTAGAELANKAMGYGTNYKDEIANSKNDDDLISGVNNAISKFESSHPIFGGDENKKNQFLKDMSKLIRVNKLADGLVTDNDTGILYLARGDELISLDDGLLKQIGRIGRDNLGSILGGALAVKSGKGFLNNMGRSAGGSGLGGAADALINANATDQDITAKDVLGKAAEEALFSAGGDLVFKGLGAVAKPTLKGLGSLTKSETVKKGVDFAKDGASSIPNANVRGAKKIAEAITGDDTKPILEHAKEYGVKVDSDNFTDIQLINPLINKIKDTSSWAAKKLHLDDVADKIKNAEGVDKDREDVINLALSSPRLAGRLYDAVISDRSGKAAEKLTNMAQKDLDEVRDMLSAVETKDTELSDIVNKYYTDTKNNFGDGIRQLKDFVTDKTTGIEKTVRLNDKAIDDMINDVTDRLSIFDKSSSKTDEIIRGLESLRGRDLTVEDLNKLRSDYNKDLNNILNKDRVTHATKVDFARGKEILEKAMDELLDNQGASDFLRNRLKSYKHMKHVADNEFFKTITNGNSSLEDVINGFEKAYNSQGKIYNDFISSLGQDDIEKFEMALIKHHVEGATGRSGVHINKEALNSKGLSEILNKIDFKSEKAKQIAKHIDNLAKAKGNLISILTHLETNYIQPKAIQKGIATTFEGARKTAVVNVARDILQKYIPYFGDDQALEYHLREGLKHLKNGGDFKGHIDSLKNTEVPKTEIKKLEDFLTKTSELTKELNKANVSKEELGVLSKEARNKKEKRGVYNVAFNSKKATNIYKDQDLKDIENAIRFERGFENKKRDRGYGAKHIQKHLDPKKDGYVTEQEVASIGDIIRNVEPKTDKDGKRVYEYYNKEGVRFRVIVGENSGKEKVITFYSDRKVGVEHNALAYDFANHNEIIPKQNEKSNGVFDLLFDDLGSELTDIQKAVAEKSPIAKKIFLDKIKRDRMIKQLIANYQAQKKGSE
ncbi:hypothetical protein [Campylobacter pinnipediorum]|uniref:hypothetical protein n=1 Tax=Campylobacter pinnipediorum TaxID=1965231 RepID=UPI00084DB78D|nr:hypothetical protein [Campylobacter pinnipediorum]